MLRITGDLPMSAKETSRRLPITCSGLADLRHASQKVVTTLP
jgi:hypothetical protein